jgi:hypothetical protein
MLTFYHAENENPHAQPQAVEDVVTTPLAPFNKLIGEGIEKWLKNSRTSKKCYSSRTIDQKIRNDIFANPFVHLGHNGLLDKVVFSPVFFRSR